MMLAWIIPRGGRRGQLTMAVAAFSLVAILLAGVAKGDDDSIQDGGGGSGSTNSGGDTAWPPADVSWPPNSSSDASAAT